MLKQIQKPIAFFDLDGTVIDSSHRQLSLPDGSIDLDHWREHCTPEQIERDSLLPLANYWKDLHAKNTHSIVICTARVMGGADFNFLQNHGLHFDAALYRSAGDNRRDADMKTAKIIYFLKALGLPAYSWQNMATLYDDNKSVLECLSQLIQTVDSTILNQVLAA